MELLYNGFRLKIREQQDGYVSPYSFFMLENIPSVAVGSSVCDFGSGTGVLSLALLTYGVDCISIIEKNRSNIHLTKYNVENNFEVSKANIAYYCEASQCSRFFDLILCNPASLPNLGNINDFCNGGEMGLDMIFEVVQFASEHLTNNGCLYLIVTELLPYKMAEDKIKQCQLEHTVIAEKIRFNH